MAMENWNEYADSVLQYVNDENAEVNEFSATMCKNFIAQGSDSPREQVRLSRTIKDILAQFTDSPLAGRKQSSRKSGIMTLDATAQEDYADMVSITVGDDYTVLTLRNDAYNHHTTFSGRKDDDNKPLTTWGDITNMLNATVLGKIEAGYISAIKGDN